MTLRDTLQGFKERVRPYENDSEAALDDLSQVVPDEYGADDDGDDNFAVYKLPPKEVA